MGCGSPVSPETGSENVLKVWVPHPSPTLPAEDRSQST